MTNLLRGLNPKARQAILEAAPKNKHYHVFHRATSDEWLICGTSATGGWIPLETAMSKEAAYARCAEPEATHPL